jgi:type IV secretion system protein VirB1
VVIAAALLACAANVAPDTLTAIVRAESGGNPLAINVNHLAGPQPKANTMSEAVEIARRFIAAGFSVDLGVSQINSQNLGSLHYTIEDAFDPCKNLAGGAAILASFYGAAVTRYGEGQRALLAAISAYNTGSFWAGLENGYVRRVVGIPSIPIGEVAISRIQQPPSPFMANTVVYTAGELNVEIH